MRTLAFLIAATALQGQELMPLPAKLTPAPGSLTIDANFRVAFTGHREPRLDAAAGRLSALLSRKTGIPMRGTGQGSAALEFRCAGPGDTDESYRLSVTPQGARIEAAQPPGVLRGMATFAQLVQLGPKGFEVPAVQIEDRPRFPWRGLMLDVARHWMPMDVIRRTLDAMAAVKLNVLHLHLADDQGFRVESRRYPKLQGMGSDGQYYTQQQIREIVDYARERAIRILPEFDMPAHTGSWFAGYPELAAGPGPYPIERGFGIFDPVLDPTREEVYQFLDGFIGEMATLFPDPYFHIGGDEVNGKQWNANPRILEFKRAQGMKDNHELQAYFTRRVQAIVQKHGKKMVGWEEILNPALSRDTVVHAWRGEKSLPQVASRGFPTILSYGYYLDMMEPAERHYLVEPEMSGGKILGGEACEWSEHVTPENVDARIWPRTAAIAERFWSPREVRDVDSMYRRLAFVSRELEWVGLEHESSFRMMTARLAGRHSAEPVRVLAEVVEPVKQYKRHNSRTYTSLTAFNRLVDVARPESRVAREFGQAVDRYLATKTGGEELRRQLVLWRDNHARLAPVLRDSALLAEAAPLSEDLTALATAALGALDGKVPPDGRALLDRAAQPRAELLISVVPPIRRLLEAAP
ncbi:MAG TPA: family 20 glycosylhydrolase [Bryobacteraceae bacterium]|nr:family 20 glycosylhydrolase [Bryobacteraceae bacterium]